VLTVAVNRRAIAGGIRRPSRQRHRDVDGGTATAATAVWAASDEAGQPASEAAIRGNVDEERRRAATVEDDEQQPLRHVRVECWS